MGVGVLSLLLVPLSGCDPSYPSTVWTDPTYDHAALSGGFELLGTHANRPCTACHASSDYEPLFKPMDGSDCQACHQSGYEVQHGAMEYPRLCALCHTSTVWSDATFSHEALAGGFELLDVHGTLPCTVCHYPDTFAPLFFPESSSDCSTCHEASAPARHLQQGFPADCTFCHTPTSWSTGTFDHQVISGGFELLGIHIALPCTFCHGGGALEPFFDPVGTEDCVACHQADYDGQHENTQYPEDCVLCHTTAGWSREEFEHLSASGGFELVGAHAGFACTLCHDPETFEPLAHPESAEDCVACHQADYEGHHGGTQFPQNCTFCHTPTEWSGGTFDHPMVSGGFELLGTHAEKACTACHHPVTFAPLFDAAGDQDCLACHLEAYEGKHGAMAYPTECGVCHTPTLWRDGSFDHGTASTGFELLGIHAEKPCTSCHDAATFQPLFSPADETDCVTCHQAKYDAQHGAEGYPTYCLYCHTPTAWADSDFDHDGDYFPIWTGEHAPRWSNCATCHTDPDDFSDFTCFTCHAHRQTAMDQKHKEEAGYSYVPSACLTCHPDGTND